MLLALVWCVSDAKNRAADSSEDDFDFEMSVFRRANDRLLQVYLFVIETLQGPDNGGCARDRFTPQ